MSTDHNGNPITIDGDMMILRVPVRSEQGPARATFMGTHKFTPEDKA